MTKINLSNENLRVIPINILNDKSITSIDLSYNLLTSLPDDFGIILSNLPKLRYLNLNNNQLKSLPHMCGFGQGLLNLPSLEKLTLVNNSLTSLPDGFGRAPNLPKLESLFLSYNKLTSLPDGFGQNLPILTDLYIRRM